jgi:hypothetical protein
MTPKILRALVLVLCLVTCFSATRPTASAPPTPNPVLYLLKSEAFQQGGKTFIRYSYDVFNKDQYSADMFAAAPNLPPCGRNANASRTWSRFL